MDRFRIAKEVGREGVTSGGSSTNSTSNSGGDSNAGFQKSKVFQGVDTTSKSLSIKDITNQVFVWAGIICVLVIVVAGIQYVISAGDPSKVTRAKNALTYAIVGLGIIVMAFSIVNFISGVF